MIIRLVLKRQQFSIMLSSRKNPKEIYSSPKSKLRIEVLLLYTNHFIVVSVYSTTIQMEILHPFTPLHLFVGFRLYLFHRLRFSFHIV